MKRSRSRRKASASRRKASASRRKTNKSHIQKKTSRTQRKTSRTHRKTSRSTTSKVRSKNSSRTKNVSRKKLRNSKYSNPLEKKCKMYLQRKIKANLKEYEDHNRYVSRSQAIAVSYSQTLKKHNDCDKIFPRRK